ncbi:MAG: S-layer protein, partial [Candidatus Diapherotrites archaeon]
LKEFSKNGSFVGKIVVGSPDLHGQFKARARDGHFCGEIAAYIGSNFLSYEMPLVYLDTMTKDLKEENSNLILIGGPLTNKLTNQANSFLPIKFEKENNWALKSNITGKTYGDDNIGVIEKINHPYFKNKTIVVIAGKRNTGTMAAIIALTKKEKVLAKQNENTKVQAKIIEALDLNGDGIIDDIEIKE